MFDWKKIRSELEDFPVEFFIPAPTHVWTALHAPHITSFKYDVCCEDPEDDDGERRIRIGSIDGYRVAQDWTLDEADVWDEADSYDGDIESYCGALIRELRCVDRVFGVGPSLSHAQRVTIVRHVTVDDEWVEHSVWSMAVAAVLMLDAPTMCIVDPQAFHRTGQPEERLETRGRISSLLPLGFQRMVSAEHLWGWNTEMQECLLEGYDYLELVKAKQDGRLAEELRHSTFEEFYNDLDPTDG